MREFCTGTVKLSNEEIRKSISIKMSLHLLDENFTDEEMMSIFNKMLSALEIGAWRVKPQICEDKEAQQKYIRARFFLGKPEEYENIAEEN